MVLIGIGANLPSPRFGTPQETCEAALAALNQRGQTVIGRSRWFRSAPVPVSDQPWFVNGVAALDTDLAPADVLAALHQIEEDFGRVRQARNEARVLDLDLLDFDGQVSAEEGGLALPHPRMHERAFVLLPLADLVPDWRHPVTGANLQTLIARLADDQVAEPVASASSA